jgi:NAD(P)-dependent dehydrogenase (short-subunit alcohol dehydrogenase family)
MKKYSDKVAIVTGAASGMGRAVARQFAALGVSVVIADISGEAGEIVAGDIRKAGGEVLFKQTDVTREDEVEQLVSAAVARFGRLDWAANMAGVPQAGGMFAPRAARDATIAVNLLGTFYCVTAQAKAMKRSGGGAIVNCSSVAGVQGSADSPYYVAAKHGVIGFTKSAALELAAHRIRVNVVCPGLTRSAMTQKFYGDKLEDVAKFVPLGRLGEPEDQANGVVWLCSDESSFVTGAAFHLDGGQTAGVPSTLVASESYLGNQ